MARSTKVHVPISYVLRGPRGGVLKHGKGSVKARERTRDAIEQAATTYLVGRYSDHVSWGYADVESHPTDAHAYARECELDDAYVRKHGRLPPMSDRRCGGGRPTNEELRRRR